MRKLYFGATVLLLLNCVNAQVTKDNWGYYAIPFLIALCFLPCTLYNAYYQEIRNFKYAKFFRHLKTNVKMIDPNMPQVNDNFKVCLLTGTVTNHAPIID